MAEIESENPSEGSYMFFCFDSDVSDCSVGRFKTSDSIPTIIQSITNWLESEKTKNKGKEIEARCDNGIIDFHTLPLSFIKGWVSY